MSKCPNFLHWLHLRNSCGLASLLQTNVQYKTCTCAMTSKSRLDPPKFNLVNPVERTTNIQRLCRMCGYIFMQWLHYAVATSFYVVWLSIFANSNVRHKTCTGAKTLTSRSNPPKHNMVDPVEQTTIIQLLCRMCLFALPCYSLPNIQIFCSDTIFLCHVAKHLCCKPTIKTRREPVPWPRRVAPICPN